jgi:TatD DNase family protein
MPVCGVGEIGLDLYWSRDFYGVQREVFHAQVELALKHDMPVVIHTRSAYDEMLDAVNRYKGRGLRGIFHAYAADVDMARKLCRAGDFFFGIGGVVTFKNSGLDAVVRDMPLELLLLETDSPYLTPVPHRGKRNESAYVRYVCQKVAEIKGISADEVAEATTRNARRMFFGE